MTSGPRDEGSEEDRGDIDRRFNEIVASWGTDQGAAQGMDQHVGHDLGRAAERDAYRGTGREADTRAGKEDPAAEEEEHFVPGPTDPLPAGDLHFWAIVVGLSIGPLLLVLSAAVPAVPTMPWAPVGAAATVGGFVLLVLRSPRRRDEDEGSGARV